MARLFGNLDNLRNYATPVIVKAKESIPQGISPTIRLDFGNIISLEDRLKQVKLRTTNHLAQYFLSDVYANYIKIKPLAPIEHTSPIVVSLPKKTPPQGGLNPTIIKFVPTQGGTTITIKNFNALLRQGGVFVNGSYFSYINIKKPKGIDEITQGIILINNIRRSFIITKLSAEPDAFLGGSKAFITVTNPKPTVNQGPGTKAIFVISTDRIAIRQGLISTGVGFRSRIVVEPMNANYLTFPNIAITLMEPVVEQPIPSGVIAIPFASSDPNIRDKAVTPRTLGYAADRALAFFAPLIKHGGEDPQHVGTTEYKNSKPFVVGKSVYSTQDAASISDALLTSEVNKINNVLQQQTDRLTFAYKLTEAEKPYFKRRATGDTKRYTYLTSPPTTYAQLSKLIDDRTTETGKPADPLQYQEVVVKFTRISDGTRPSITLSAFVKGLSDNYAIGTSDIKFVGRQDTYKLYNGTTRQISLSLQVVAMGNKDNKFKNSAQYAKQLAEKVNRLVNICAIGQIGNQSYTIGPVVRFSMERSDGVGGPFKNLVAVVNSLKVDIQTEENPWDVDEVLPMIYDVSIDMSILSAKNEQTFGTNKTYIG